MITFYLPGKPVTITEQQKGVRVVRGRPHFFTKPEVLAARAHVARYINPSQPPMHGPVRLAITYVFPLLKSDKGPADVLIPMYVRPDADNLTKLILDVLTARGVYVDDGQVCILYVAKLRGLEPGTTIIVESIEQK